MQGWKWDIWHVLILLSFATGLTWSGANFVAALVASGQPLTVTTVLPFVITVIGGITGFFKNPPSNPVAALQEGAGGAAQKRGFARPELLLSIVGFGLIGISVICFSVSSACTPAQVAVEQRIVQVVAQDVAAGKSYEAAELDVATIVCGAISPPTVPICDGAVMLFNDALALLVDLGVVPGGWISTPAQLEQAKGWLARAKLEAAARGAK